MNKGVSVFYDVGRGGLFFFTNYQPLSTVRIGLGMTLLPDLETPS